MMFQASNFKGNHFLDLLDDDNIIIELLYVKGRPWFKMLGHSNSLYTQTTRAITNHALTDEYRLRFFPREEFKCPCVLWDTLSTNDFILFYFIFSNFTLLFLFFLF